MTDLTKKEGIRWGASEQATFEGRPIAYYSKALGDRNLTKSAYGKELMAVALSIHHWRSYLMGRKFTVFYKPGLENKGVDALSRMHDSVELKSLVHYPTWLGTEEVVKEVHDDVVLKEIIAALEKGEPTK
ncbi:hypothetical protein KIW84_054292 [Lathyrus oleraceus]|uniref:Reverse transcriptase RNase H-like domain-containing protein n=1 Tax=Pisum sativum TaxID=3888 RepID=A0A9D4WSQ2_PEA|nr:hypothetical protein KIW84_054292 [Pisum sativum]